MKYLACKNQNYHLPVRHRALDSVELKRHGLGNKDRKNQYVIPQKCGSFKKKKIQKYSRFVKL